MYEGSKWEPVDEEWFRARLYYKLEVYKYKHGPFTFVTGPGRSGAVAAVYASHYLGVPYIPPKFRQASTALVVDTARLSGKTIRKCASWHGTEHMLWAFDEVPGHYYKFWYEDVSFNREREFLK